MRKVIAALTIFVLLLSIVSCQSSPIKKIIPKSEAPRVEDNTVEKVQEPKPAGSSSDQKIDDKVKVDNKEQVDSKEKEDKKDTSNKDSQINGAGNIPSNLSGEKIVYWMPGRNTEHKVPSLNAKFKNLLGKYGGYFVGDTDSKVIYLTFDEGYENGYTGKILDILKANGVEAAFFVTKPYIKSEPELVKRMVSEGHIVANHTDKHPSLPDVSNERAVKEIMDTADYFKGVTGTDMPKFIRPPMGEWSERTLYITNSLGYKTILWSMAHQDWDPNKQPGKEAAYKFVDTYYHNGAILLLHAVSKSNTEALDDIIKNLKGKGYRFASLTELK